MPRLSGIHLNQHYLYFFDTRIIEWRHYTDQRRCRPIVRPTRHCRGQRRRQCLEKIKSATAVELQHRPGASTLPAMTTSILHCKLVRDLASSCRRRFRVSSELHPVCFVHYRQGVLLAEGVGNTANFCTTAPVSFVS